MDSLLARSASDAETWPHAWRGHWIGSARPSATDFAFAPTVEREPFNRTIFSTSFELGEGEHEGRLRLTADSRYALYVNGVEQGRGPVRSQPRRLTYDDYDIASALRDGDNSITVVVTYYSQPNSFWQPAVNNLSLGAGAVLALEAEIDGEWIVSDDDGWSVLSGRAWTIPPIEGLNGVPVERVDARLLPEGWRTGPGETSSGWRQAVVVPALHIGALARSTPPTDPYGPLSPRPIGALGGDVVRPVAATSVRLARLEPDEHPARAVAAYLPAWGAAASVPAGDTVAVELTGDEIEHVWLDFGRVVCGFVRFGLDAPAGSTIDLAYREKAFDPAKEEESTAPAVGARYIARGAGDAFDALESNGFRYVHVVLSGPGRVTLSDFRVQENLYPRQGEASFRSSDAALDSLYRAGVRTAFLNSQDAFLDCPTREQRAWVGDGVIHQMVHLTTSTDWRLASWYVTLADSPRPDGILPMSVVGDIEYGGGYTIPDWSLNWIHAVHNLYRYLGDKRLLGEVLSTVRSVLRWYESFQDDTGILADVPEWNLVDWSSVLTAGRSSILTALWARGLREYAEMSRFIGNAGDAEWAEALWTRAHGGYEQFWDAQRGTYVDGLDPRHPIAPTSQIAGAAAIISGLAPRERWNSIIDRITDADRLVIRSWIGGNGGYDEERMTEQLNGIQRIDWNAQEEVVRAEPFMSYIVHDAIALAGRAAELPKALAAWQEFLVDGYDTFGECWGWGTPSHGWSSTPTRDIVQYLLGVTPDAPGFGKARIAPAFGVVDWMEGSAPTPSGLLSVRVDPGAVSVDSPVPYVLVLPDREVVGEPGSTTFTYAGSI